MARRGGGNADRLQDGFVIAGEQAVPALIDALKETTPENRYYVFKALSKLELNKTHVHAVPALVAGLKDTDPKVRYYSAKCIKDIGPAAKAAIPALKEAAKDAKK